MKISSISNSDSKFINRLNYSSNANSNSFKGYVNGKYFRDEIITKAKEALKDPNWRDRLLASKRTLEESFTTWHKREGSNDIVCRVLMGISTLGLTEITWGITQAIADAMDNDNIDRDIKEIEDCLDNMGKGNSQ